jgi:predicted lactoylglutathione lyase
MALDHNELIGEAYTHGLMYGEIFDEMDGNNLETILLT